MKISTEQLAAQLQKRLAPLYTIHGAEPLLALEAADRIRALARAQGHIVREVLTVESGFDWSQVGMSAASMSLFGDRRIFELRIPTGKPGVEGGKALEAFAANPPDDAVSLVLLPELDRTVLQGKWFGALEAASVCVEARAITRDHLPQWLAGRLREQGQQADSETLEMIADRVEGNLLAAYQEIQKLALLFPAGPLERDAVLEAVVDVSRFDIFQLGEAILGGDANRISRLIEHLRGEGAALPLVLWAIVGEIRAQLAVLAAQRERRSLSQQELRENRLWGGREAAVTRAARRANSRQLTVALGYAAQADRLAKGLGRGDPWDACLQLALAAAGRSALPLVAA